MPTLLKRTISTLILWAIVFSLLYFCDGAGAVWLVAIMVMLTLYEFDSLMKHSGFHPFGWLNILVGGAMVLVPFYFPQTGVAASDLLVLGVIISSIRILAEREPANRVESLAFTLFGLAYVPLMLQYFVRVITIPNTGEYGGILLFVWIVMASKLCDTGALLTGMAIGRHKMTPVISPKKTWEGAAGGILTSALISAAFAALFSSYLPAGFTPLFAGLAALPIAALGIVADLVESIIKRRANIKDSGSTIPGIGGMFDVTDSLILTAPLAYWLLRLI